MTRDKTNAVRWHNESLKLAFVGCAAVPQSEFSTHHTPLQYGSYSDVCDGAGFADALHDTGNDLVGPNLVALFKTLIQERLECRLPLHWRRYLQQRRPL